MSPLEITIGIYTIRNLFIQFLFKYCNHMNDIEMTAL